MPQRPKTLKQDRRLAPFAHAYAMILAGGSGTRFWPLSRRAQPKQLLRLFGKDSLLVQTADRLRGLIPPERTYVFTNSLIRDAVRRELPRIPRAQIVAEPASRNTAPAIGLAAYEVARRDPEGVMIILPSDHVIAKPAAFRQALATACEVASSEGRSVVIGVKPMRPETGFGYVQLARHDHRGTGHSISNVVQFTEKPPLETAKEYVRSGRYLWNAGMFVWKASTLIANLRRFQPRMAAQLRSISESGGIRSEKTLKRLYPRLENISVDYALMEKISNVYAVSADMGWSDVGSWAAAYELSPKSIEENVTPPSGLALDSHRNMIISPKKFVATVGVEDLIIIETDDALLVCSRSHSQDVGKVVKELARLEQRKLL
ncbi:MAG: mannose-1-phosphate guanylyltransferase [Acidobacteriota bacterium]|nr:mannose-1-phosphate guanylyltransferase [Acidobacteriota bacterium]